MKGKTTTRILAWIMSVCMVIGLVPATPYEYTAQAAVGDTVVYDFTKVASANTTSSSPLLLFYSTSNSSGAGEADVDWSTVSTYEKAEAVGSAPWQAFYSYASKDCYAGFYNNLGFYMFMRSGSRGPSVRVNLKIKNSGWYMLSSQLNNAYNANDGTITYSLYEGGESSLNGTKMFQNSFVPASGLQTFSLNEGEAVYLDASKIYVADFDAKGGSKNKGQYYVYNITLTETAAPTEETPTVYDFSGAVTGATGDVTLWCSNTGVDNSTAYNTFTYANASAKGSLPWMYLSKSSSNNSRNYWSMNANGFYVRTNQGRQTTVNFKIKVPETGYYELTPEYRVTLGTANAGDTAPHSGVIQLFESDGVTGIAIIEEKTSTSGYITKSMGVHYLEKDKEYILKLNVNGGNSSGNGNYAYLNKLSVEEKLPVIASLSASAVEASAGETKTITISANYGDDPIDMTADDVAVETEVTVGAVQVSYNAGTLSVTPSQNGVNKIKVTVKYGGMSDSHEVALYSMPDDDGAESYVYDFNGSKPEGYTGAVLLQSMPELANFANSLLKGSAPWMYHSGGEQFSGNNIWTYEMSSSYAFTLRQRDGSVPPRKLRVFLPSDGLYNASVNTYNWASATRSDYSLIPCDKDGNETGSEIVLGHVDGYTAGGATTTDSYLGKAQLSRGYYILKMSQHRQDATLQYTRLNSITLTRVNADVSYETPAPVAIGESVEMPFNATVSGAAAECTAISAGASSNIEVALNGDKNALVFTGVKAGKENVSVTLSFGDVKQTLTIPVYVYDRYAIGAETYTYDFLKQSAAKEINLITSFNATTENATEEINTARASAPWRFENSVDNPYFSNTAPHTYGFLLGKTAGTAIRVRVPQNGRYELYNRGRKWTEGGNLSIYVQNANGDGKFASKTLVNTVDTYASTDSADTKELMYYGTIDLVAGDYIVTYELAKTSSAKDPRAAISGLILKGVDTSLELNLAVSKPETMLVGQSYELPILITMAGVIPVDISKYTVTLGASSNPAAADIAVKKYENGQYYLDVKGLIDDETRVTLNVAGNGMELTATELISVNSERMLYEDVVYDFMKTNTYSGTNIPISEFTDFQTSIDAGSAPWKFLENNATDLFAYITKSYGFYMKGRGKRKLVIYVPETNTYVPEVYVDLWTEGTTAVYSLTPSDENGNVTGEEVELGLINSSGSGGSEWKTIAMDKQYIEKGYYVLTMSIGELKYITNSFALRNQAVVLGTETPAPVAEGETIEIPVAAAMISDPDADVAFDRITFDTADASIASFEGGEDGKTVKITGLKAGTTTVALRVGVGDLSARRVISVTVYDKNATTDSAEYRYWFGKANKDAEMSEMDSFNYTTAGVDGEVNPSRATAPWRYEGSSDAPEFKVYTPDGYGTLLGKTAGTSVRIRVPKNGKFSFVSENWFQNEGGKLSVYIQRADGAGEYAKKTLLGTINTYDDQKQPDYLRRTKLADIALAAGDYIVTYVNEGDGVRTAIGGIYLMSPKAKDSFAISPKTSAVATVDETVRIPLNFSSALGTLPGRAGLTFTVNASAAGYVDTMAVIDGENVYLDVTGIKVGETRLDIQATDAQGAPALDASVAISVIEQASSAPGDLYYDFMKTNPGKNVVLKTDTFDNFDVSIAAGSAPWKYGGMTGGAFQYNGAGTYGLYMQGQGSYSLVLQVPASGSYKLAAEMYAYSHGTKAYTSLTPCDKNGGPVGAAINLGIIDSLSSTSKVITVPVGTHYLEAGYYLWTMEFKDAKSPYVAADGTTYAARAILNGIIMDYAELMVSSKLDNTYVLTGNEKRIPINAILLGENIDWAQDAEFTVAWKNQTQIDEDGNDITSAEPYAAVAVEKSADGKTAELVITGVADGSTDVEVSVTMGGRQASVSGTVTVSSMGNVLGEIVLSDDYFILNAGVPQTIGVTAYTIDGSVASGAKIYFESGDQSIVRINDAGELTAVGEGTTSVMVYVELGGVIQNAAATVRVVDGTDITSVSINPVKQIKTGASAVLSLSGVRASGLSANIDQSLVKYELVSADPEEAFTLEGNTLTANVEGTAQVSATFGEFTAEAITVIAADSAPASFMELDFRVNQQGAPTDAAYATHGWEIDRSNTAPATLAQRNNLVYKSAVGIAAKLTKADATRDSDLTVNFSVNADGEYALDMLGGKYADGALAYVYVDEVYVGSYDFCGNDQASGDLAELNSIALTAGEHKITFRRASGGEFIYPGLVKIVLLDEAPSFEKIEATAAKTVMSVGESCAYIVSAKLSNGRTYCFGPLFDGSADANNYIKLNNLNENVVEMADGKLHAKKSGTATIAIAAKIGEVEKSTSFNVSVDDAVMESFTAALAESSLYVGGASALELNAILSNGRAISSDDLEIDVLIPDESVAKYENGEIVALGAGRTNIAISATLGDVTLTHSVSLTVKAHGATKLVLSADTTVMSPSAEGSQIHISAAISSGEVVNVNPANAVYTSSNTAVITVSETGVVTPVAIGQATVKVEAEVGGIALSGNVSFKVTDGKTAGSYYTPEKVAAARRNVEKYDWAKKKKASAVATADFFVDKLDFLYKHMTTNQLPRTSTISLRYDMESNLCLYCGKELTAEYGKRCWVIDVFNSPWKIQCPSCRRKFPSNDFGSFYDLGIVKAGEEETYGVEAGSWSYEKSHYEHFELFKEDYVRAGVASYSEYNAMGARGETIPGVGYLKNDMYKELEGIEYTAYNLPDIDGVIPSVTVQLHNYGVDDGYGYNPGIYWTQRHPYYKQGEPPIKHYRQWSFIAFYNHYGIWNSYNDNRSGVMYGAITALADAYLYTGEKKYGRAGAILVDRFADVYPDFNGDWQVWDKGGRYQGQDYYVTYANSDSTRPKGKMLGSIWQHGLSRYYTLGYDAFYDAYEDPYVVDYLNSYAEEWNLEDKSTPNAIRQHIEDDLLRENFRSICNGNIHGNFGMQQSLAAYTGVVLDTQPESREMIDWMYRSGIGTHGDDNITGGNVLVTLINNVRRDGHGNEGSPNYNALWNNAIETIAEALDGYEGYPEMDMYKNPKFINMLKSFLPIIMIRRTTVQNGDSGETADTNIIAPTTSRLVRMFQKTGMVEFAQFAYFRNGNKVDGLYTSIFDEDPVASQKEIQKAINTYGEYDFDKSVQLGGYGFTALRGGSLYTDKDTQRDFWMYYGKASGHGHPDTLNLGIHAYGLDMAPEMAYPEIMGGEISENWGYTSINHNLVVVNGSKQSRITTNAEPKHYDDAGRVKVMDVDASGGATYQKAGTDIYRRTVVMVEATDEVSYGVDFFRVRGGNDHLYSFHSQSDEIYETEGLNMGSTQTMGSYAGIDVPYRTPGYESGFTYFNNVRRDTNLESNEFAVDFAVKDFRNTIEDNQGLHLRMTMLNDFKLTEVSFQQAEPPRVKGNPKMLEFVFARRKGTNLDSLFTTVFEPYRDNRYISDMEQVDAEILSGVEGDGDAVKAVKVTLENGRQDYIVYATNNKVLYRIDNKFNFRGFVGVCTMAEGEIVYSYVNDGDTIGNRTAQAAYTGKVLGFTKDLSIENSITVELDQVADVNELKGRFIYINNDKSENAAYPIEDVKSLNGRTAVLDIGGETLIRACKDAVNLDAGYIYNIEEGQTFSIPLSSTYASAPVFNKVSDKKAAVGNRLSFTVAAESPADREITYTAVSLPRGATFNSETKTVAWTPDSKQIGKHHIEIMADDGILSTNIHVNVEVYQGSSSAGGSSDSSSTGGSSDSGTSGGSTGGSSGGSTGGSGGGGASGGGASSGGGSSSGGSTNVGDGASDVPSTETPSTGDTPTERFTDLGNYAWAKDAIYALVEKDVVNGTSESTFSPAANIKRADFAIMLVRAFGITEGEGENFADVDSSKYYAEELRLAKVAGIVNGIGNDKFNPEGQITRQDMMLMLSRALDAMEIELAEADASVLAQFSDAANIADYARDAVSRVVKAGVITGSNGKLNPLAQATRAEVAVMLSRVLGK